ncbi:hypothetical protein J2S09_004886 [Bacillus fengqiuensis]|nr:hypothetical protein [Bacillus fengqiuensis]
MSKNKYIMSYVPLLTIVLFSMSLGIYLSFFFIDLSQSLGIYEGLRLFFSTRELTVTLFLLLSFFFFMLFAALKLIGDTLMGMSLFLFSKEQVEEETEKIHKGTVIFLAGAFVSLIVSHSLLWIVLSIFVTACVYFIYVVYEMHGLFKPLPLVGFIFFHILTWAIFFSGIIYLSLTFYNSMLKSLPI